LWYNVITLAKNWSSGGSMYNEHAESEEVYGRKEAMWDAIGMAMLVPLCYACFVLGWAVLA